MHTRGCRDNESGIQWAASLIHSNLIVECLRILEGLDGPRHKTNFGFQLELLPDMQHDDPRIDRDDEWAGLLVSMTTSLVARRLKRKLYMFGIPDWLVELCVWPSEADRLMTELRLDLEAKEALELQPASPPRSSSCPGVCRGPLRRSTPLLAPSPSGGGRRWAAHSHGWRGTRCSAAGPP